jgi:TonB family protein
MPAAPAIAPAPVGGTTALRNYLRREAAAFVPENNAPRLNGSVRIKFVVGSDGKLSDVKVTRGLRDDYDAEALRIVCEGPAWQPGIAGGRRAPLLMEVAVPF